MFDFLSRDFGVPVAENININLENELQHSEAKFRIILETAAQGILLVNIHGQITMVNTKVEQLFGYDRDELIDASIELLIPNAYKDIHVRKRNHFILNPENRPMANTKSIFGKKKDGSEFPIEVHLTSVEMYDGPNIAAFITDISKHKKMENRIRRMEKLEAIGQLAGGIAHDFNNVLAGIIGLTELAQRKLPADSPANKNLTMVIQKSQDAAELVKQLLAFSRQQVLDPRPLNLNRQIQNNEKLLQRYLGEDIQLSLQLDTKLRNIHGDSSAVDQIITNLCINARDAMPDGGELSISTKNVDITEEDIPLKQISPQIDFVKLSISDTGIGMRAEVQKHAFEPFFSTKEFGQGTGLGLATVYGLVEQHGGVVKFDSIPGEGTSFYLYFPAIEQEVKIQPDVSQNKVKGGNETILLIDDEQDIASSLTETLQSYGYTVYHAENGISGLELFDQHEHKIDLVISDVIMPKMGGVELKMHIKNKKPSVKFMHISAYSDKVKQDRFYLQKPFLSKDLLLKIREILDIPA